MNKKNIILVYSNILMLILTLWQGNNVLAKSDNSSSKKIKSDSDTETKEMVLQCIKIIRTKDPKKISDIIKYPYCNLPPPLSSIKDSQEFLKRFYEVFDDKLINDIASSNTKDWSEVGFRGIMYKNGLVWIDKDSGKLKTINYDTDIAKQNRDALILKDKQNIHYSINKYEEPILKAVGKRLLIRLDRIENENIRLCIWFFENDKNPNALEVEKNKPNIIATNGEEKTQGSIGRTSYIFPENNKIIIVDRDLEGMSWSFLEYVARFLTKKQDCVVNVVELAIYTDFYKGENYDTNYIESIETEKHLLVRIY